MTSGTVVVAFLTASDAGVPAVTITSTFAAKEFSDQRRKPFVLSVRPTILDEDVAAFLITELAQTVPERFDKIGFERCGRVTHEADTRNFRLRVRV